MSMRGIEGFVSQFLFCFGFVVASVSFHVAMDEEDWCLAGVAFLNTWAGKGGVFVLFAGQFC